MADEMQSTENCDDASLQERKLPVLTKADKLHQAYILKGEGNAFYKQKDYKNAMKKYHQALLYVKGLHFDKMPFQEMLPAQSTSKHSEETPEFKQEVEQIALSCYNNLAACHLAGERWSKVVENCSKVCAQKWRQRCMEIPTYTGKVLKSQPHNAKALYRRGQAYMKLKDIDRAKEDMKQASHLEPTDSNIKKSLALLDKENKKIEESQKKTYAAMFGNMCA